MRIWQYVLHYFFCTLTFDKRMIFFFIFSVHSSIMKKDLKFFEADAIPLRQMLQCATACMAMPEVASVKHAASFISNFLIVSRESQYLVSISNDMGEGIFRQVTSRGN